MHKILKIAISLLLVLSIILNPFCSAFNIKSEAVAPVIIEFLKYAFVELLKGAATGTTVVLGKEAAELGIEAYEESQRIELYSLNALEKGVGVYLEPGINGSIPSITASINDDAELTDDERLFARYFVNYVNAHPEEFKVGCNSFVGEYDMKMTAEQYEKIKNAVTNAYNDYTFNQIAEKNLSDDIVGMVQNGVLPQYDFSFVGPTNPMMTFPSTTTTSTSTLAGGFRFTSPVSSFVGSSSGAYCTSEAGALASGADEVNASGDYWRAKFVTECYGYSHYCLYNGKLYFKKGREYSDNLSTSTTYLQNPYFLAKHYVAADGKTLVDDGFTDGSPCSIGLAFNITNELASSVPLKETITEDEFTTTTDGASVEIPRTDAEQIIGNALGLGLINPSDSLEIGEDGTIVGADGLLLSSIQELVAALESGNLQFENIQDYLDVITRLISSGNYTAAEQKTLLENIEAFNKTQVKGIEEINETLLSIYDSLAIETDVVINNEFNVDTPDTIIDKFPFCLPFDVYTVFNLLSAEPETPSFDIPLKMDGIFDFTITVDLSDFNEIANIFRWFLYIIFILGLIFVTNSLIGRG